MCVFASLIVIFSWLWFCCLLVVFLVQEFDLSSSSSNALLYHMEQSKMKWVSLNVQLNATSGLPASATIDPYASGLLRPYRVHVTKSGRLIFLFFMCHHFLEFLVPSVFVFVSFFGFSLAASIAYSRALWLWCLASRFCFRTVLFPGSNVFSHSVFLFFLFSLVICAVSFS